MRKKIIWTVIVVVLVALAAAAFYVKTNLKGWLINPTNGSTQMLLVTAKDWNSTTGNLQRFERASLKYPWRKVGDLIPVNLGQNGMGWGIGLHGASLTEGPKVIEGAKKTPVGVFAINLAFGKDNAKDAEVKLPYMQITNTIFCPDDPKSKFYNRLVDTKTTSKDWASAEDMNKLAQDGFYAAGFVVSHNYDHPSVGMGSCFFVHAGALNAPTLGCTSLDVNLVKEISVWLEPARKPILVQLPETIYKEFKDRWELPQI